MGDHINQLLKMIKILFRFNFLLIIVVFVSSSVVECAGGDQIMVVAAVYVFGDSLVDVGNNNHLPLSLARANFPHNGLDFPSKTPTGRFCNGKNAADFLAEKVGLPSPPAYLSVQKNSNAPSILTGVSFASGGAGIFNGTDQSLGQSIPLTQQVKYYTLVYQDLVKQLGSSEAEEHLSKSLFFIVIGSNDLFDYFGSSSLQKNYTSQQYVNSMSESLKLHIKYLYSTGARKFAVAGLPPIGCSPVERVKKENEECDEVNNQVCVKYNNGLKSMLENLNSELEDMFYSYFETYDVVQNIVQQPASYGYSEVKAACCGLGKLKANIPCIPISTYCSNRNNTLFWDLYHPTEATARIIVDAYFNGSEQYTSPMNLKQLIAL